MSENPTHSEPTPELDVFGLIDGPTLRMLFERSPAALAITIGPEHRFAHANPAFQALMGDRPFLGRSVSETLPWECREGLSFNHVFSSGTAVKGMEYRAPMGSDGTSKLWSFDQMPLRQKDGSVIGVITRGENRSELAKAQHTALEAKRLLDGILDYLPEGIVIARAPDVTITHVSAFGKALIGRDSSEIEGIPVQMHVEAWDVLRNDGTRPTPEELPLTRATVQGEVIQNEDWILRSKGGVEIPVRCNAGPIRDASGRITEGVIAWRDVTAIREAEKQRSFLLREMAHRIKNTLTVVGSIARRTFIPGRDRQASLETFLERLAAMGRAQSLVAVGVDNPVSLKQVIDASLGVYSGDPAVKIKGENPVLHPELASKLTLVLYELCTNASKYGALSSTAGKLYIETVREGENHLLIQWIESNGPLVVEPRTKGFGTRLITHITKSELRGEAVIRFEATGLCCDLRFPHSMPNQ